MLRYIEKIRNYVRDFAYKNSNIVKRLNVATKMATLAAITVVIPLAVTKPENYQTSLKLDTGSENVLVSPSNTINIITTPSRADVKTATRSLDSNALKGLMQEIAPEYGIDWKFVYAIGYLESGYKSSLAQRNYNFFGRKATSTTYRKWNDPEEAIRDQFAYLKTHYYDRGLNTPAKIGPIYCEGNTWAGKVSTIMRTL